MPPSSKRGLVAPQNRFLETIIRKTSQIENRKYENCDLPKIRLYSCLYEQWQYKELNYANKAI